MKILALVAAATLTSAAVPASAGILGCGCDNWNGASIGSQGGSIGSSYPSYAYSFTVAGHTFLTETRPSQSLINSTRAYYSAKRQHEGYTSRGAR
jgi:hypothetical protein